MMMQGHRLLGNNRPVGAVSQVGVVHWSFHAVSKAVAAKWNGDRLLVVATKMVARQQQHLA